jgi:oligoendopeptidase F
MEIKLFRDENIPLQVEDAKLSQRYQKITGAMTVNFKGSEQTLQQLGRYLEETDRSLRKEAWEAIAARRAKDREEMEGLFDEMVKLRTKIAKNAGFKNTETSRQAKHRFDYSPTDCVAFHSRGRSRRTAGARSAEAPQAPARRRCAGPWGWQWT